MFHRPSDESLLFERVSMIQDFEMTVEVGSWSYFCFWIPETGFYIVGTPEDEPCEEYPVLSSGSLEEFIKTLRDLLSQ